MEEFKINGYPEYTFRAADVSPVDILSITPLFDMEHFENMRQVTEFILENVEVQINEKWFRVKERGHEVYMPLGIEKKLSALNEIRRWYTNNIFVQVFQESEG